MAPVTLPPSARANVSMPLPGAAALLSVTVSMPLKANVGLTSPAPLAACAAAGRFFAKPAAELSILHDPRGNRQAVGAATAIDENLADDRCQVEFPLRRPVDNDFCLGRITAGQADGDDILAGGAAD